jgi:hypothetical protein
MSTTAAPTPARNDDLARAFLRPRGIISLWFGVLAGPTAALVCLEVAYMSVPWACRTGHVLPLHLVPLVTALVAIVAGLVARRDWTVVEPTWPDDAEGVLSRTRFMAACGVMLSAFSVLVIVGQWLAIFILDPCFFT